MDILGVLGIVFTLLVFIWMNQKENFNSKQLPLDKSKRTDLSSLVRYVINETPLQKPSTAWIKVNSRKTIELYDHDRSHLANAISGLARSRGNIDIDITPNQFASKIRGFAYPISAVSEWAQKRSRMTISEFEFLEVLQEEGLLDQDFEVDPWHKEWVVCAYTSPDSFIHERVHTLWIQETDFRDQVLQWWREHTNHLSIAEKRNLTKTHNLMGGENRWNMLMKRGEETFVEEFMATYIEKLSTLRN